MSHAASLNQWQSTYHNSIYSQSDSVLIKNTWILTNGSPYLGNTSNCEHFVPSVMLKLDLNHPMLTEKRKGTRNKPTNPPPPPLQYKHATLDINKKCSQTVIANVIIKQKLFCLAS